MSLNKKLRIAIIGAGPCGISQLLAFKAAAEADLIELICFERQSDWGGLWRYTPLIGIDAFGEPIHSSMYRQLWSNNPKELLESPEYTFYDHFHCVLPSYVPRAIIYDYLIGRANANDIKKWVRFNVAVRFVDFDQFHDEFTIEVEDLKSATNQTLKYDRVIVASGHYHVPNMINIEGIERFQGRILHSHEFRGADEFTGMNLLIIGGGFSADDIALQCYKFGTRSITISSRNGPVGYKWPENVRERPMTTRISSRSVSFTDGSTVENIDAIIICTGYRHLYPFMTRHLRLECGITDLVPSNLYKSIFWINQPKLAYLGTPRQAYSFPMFDAQAALVCDVFLDRIKLPSRNEQQKDIEMWKSKEQSMAPATFDSITDLQTDYIQDIHNLLRSQNPNLKLLKYDLNKANRIAKSYFEDKVRDILNYRCKSYPSFVDQKHQSIAAVSQTWIDNKDDEMDRFLEYYRKNSS